MNKSITGIYRLQQNNRPFPVFTGVPGITSGNWSWAGGSSDSFASAQGHQMLFAGTIENLTQLQQSLGLPRHTGAARTAIMLYLKYGVSFPLEIQGSFCFAILDYITGELLLGRDYLGRQSLFWGQTPEGFYVFSDRLGALKKFFSAGSLNISLPALNEYLGRGCISAPRTIYQEISRVEAASLVRIMQDGRIHRSRYWHPEYLPKFRGRFSEAVSRCRSYLEDSVRECCSGRDSLSCLLSGGLDSNLVLAHARPYLSGHSFRAVTVSFANPRYDEAPLACLSAAGFGIPLDVIRAHAEDLQKTGMKILQNQDEPYADSSLLPLTLACETFSGGRTAVFTGDGGDEIFGGYRRYQAMLWRQIFNHGAGRGLLKSIYFLDRVLSAGPENRSFRTTLYRFIKAMNQDTLASFLSFQNIFSPELRQELCTGKADTEESLPAEALYRFLQTEDDCERCIALDMLNYLPYDCLRKSELSAGGNNHLELLSPLLSRPLVEFVLRLPRHWKTTIFQRKRILRSMAQKMLPGKLLQQQKRGFGVPLGEWFRTSWADEIRSLAEDHSRWDSQGWLNPDFISLMIQQHLQGQTDHSARIWNLLCLRKWLENQNRI